MQRKILVLTLVFSFFTTAISAFEIVRALFHVHSFCSDGDFDFLTLKEMAIKDGDRAIFITDHSDMMLNTFEECRFPNYRKSIEALSDENFIAVAGLEETVDPTIDSYYHVNKFSEVENPYIWTKDYSHLRPEDFIDSVCRKENAICCVNHLKDAPDWQGKVGVFDCMELMNDFSLNGDSDYGYRIHTSLYFKTLSEGWRGFIVGGSDFHKEMQKKIRLLQGNSSTYFFPDEFTRDSLLSAFREGRTIATKNLTIEYIDSYPSNKVKWVGEWGMRINLRYRIKNEDGNPAVWVRKSDSFDIYKTLEPKITAKDSDYTTYSIGFFDKELSYDEPTCYILIVDKHLVTSPYCYQKIDLRSNENRIYPIKGIEIGKSFEKACWSYNGQGIPEMVDVHSFKIDFDNHPSAMLHRYREVCDKDFIYDAEGRIVGCKKPLMIFVNGAEGFFGEEKILDSFPYLVDYGKINLPIFNSGDCSQSYQENGFGYEKGWFSSYRDAERCKDAILDSSQPLIIPSNNSFRCAAGGWLGQHPNNTCYIITDREDLEYGDRFAICDPESIPVFSQDGNVGSCRIIGEGQMANRLYVGPINSHVAGNECQAQMRYTLKIDSLTIHPQDYFWLIKK